MTSKPDDWMPLHIGVYLADTTHLTRDQHGAYLLLIMAYWRKGAALPDDDGQLAAMAKASPAEWRKMKGVIGGLFIIENGRWMQKRCEEELEKARTLMAAKSKSGKEGARRRWHSDGKPNGEQDGKVIAEASGSDRQTDAPSTKNQEHLPSEESSLRSDLAGEVPSPSKPSKSRKKQKEPENIEFPDWWPKPQWEAFAEMRRSRRATLTPGAIQIAIRDMTKWRDEGQDPSAIIEQSTLKGYRGLFPVKRDGSVSPPAAVASGGVSDPRARRPGESDDHHKVRLFHDHRLWPDSWGARPDDPDACSMSKAILIEFGYLPRKDAA